MPTSFTSRSFPSDRIWITLAAVRAAIEGAV